MVAGTDTGVGKTTFAAALALALDAAYWKPLQSGRPTDAERVARIAGLRADRLLPERHVFSRAISPHRAAELEGVSIDPEALAELPACRRPVVIETAGGLLVPITRSLLQADLLARWRLPVALCARTTLGTINHALLSLEALRHRGVPLLGVAFIGEPNEDNERTIIELSRAPRLGRLPLLPRLEPEALRRAFAENFRTEDFFAHAR